ncbi:MAG: hypothetical protein UZ21_OP11001000552 [Microgenomates bacterium OLB22]|nr:MAG: hypothetical protein UZ21_OP11001000552 [Microgenomates bacterium OLB22]
MSKKVLKGIVRETIIHHIDYLLLLGASVYTVAIALLKQENHDAQRTVIALYGLFYMIWGWFHHRKEKSFHIKVLAEYVLIGLLVIFFAFSFL